MLQPEDKDLDKSGAAGDFCTCGFCKLVWDQTARGEKKTAQKTNNAGKQESWRRVRTCCCCCRYDIIALVSSTHTHRPTPQGHSLTHTHTLAQLFVAQMNIPQAARDATKYAKFLCQSANENSQRYTKLQGYMYVCAGVEWVTTVILRRYICLCEMPTKA